jgi:hypothetical protein
MRAPGGGVMPRCLRCALQFGPMLRRSLAVATVVGSILTAINQGNIILDGDFPPALYWKIPLTYSVPFCVATTGALLNGRSTGAPS